MSYYSSTLFSFLGKNSTTGLDISDHALVTAELLKKNKGLSLGRYDMEALPLGLIESGMVHNPNRLIEILSRFVRKNKIKNARISVPVEKVYFATYTVPNVSAKKLRDEVKKNLKEHVPVPVSELLVSYDVLAKSDREVVVHVSAVSKILIKKYLSVFKRAGLSASAIELKGHSLLRSLIAKKDDQAYMIVEFGFLKTTVYIVQEGVLLGQIESPVGGMLLSRLLEKNCNILFEDAESFRKEHGISKNPEHKKLCMPLMKGLSVLTDDIDDLYIHWHTAKHDLIKKHKIEKIILVGDNADMPGLAAYIQATLRLPVEDGNVWTNIMDIKTELPPVTFRDSLHFAGALGLALGGFENE